jgi:hypothetical protein
MPPRKLPTMLHDRATLLEMLNECDEGKFGHLREPEHAILRSGIKRRLAEIDVEIKRVENA